MALNSTGPISLAGNTAGQSVALELGRSGTASISLNDADVRGLLGVASGTISLSSAYGKSSAPVYQDPGSSVTAINNSTAGLRGVGRSGYHNENVNYTDIQNQGPFGPYTTLNISGFATGISRLYRGYFRPASTGDYRFRLTSDDGAYMWIGTNAISGYNTSNLIINNGGSHAAQAITSNFWNLTANRFYHIRIVYGNNAGNGQVTLEWEGPGQAFTTNGTNRYFYNSATNGF
jgi:hypothetical protein